MKIHQEIEERYGEEMLKQAVERLCYHCCKTTSYAPSDWRNVTCHMYPITTKGEDCPYYEKRP